MCEHMYTLLAGQNPKMASRRPFASPAGHFHLPLLCNERRLPHITANFKRNHLLAYLEEKSNTPERHAIRNLLGVLAYRQDGDRQGALEYFNHILRPGEDLGNLNALANREFVMSGARGGIPEPDLSTDEGKMAQARSYAEQAFALIDEKSNDAIVYERLSRALELCNRAMELAGRLVSFGESNDWRYLAGSSRYDMLQKTMRKRETHDEAYKASEDAAWDFWFVAENRHSGVRMKSSAWVRIGFILHWASKHSVQIGYMPHALEEFIGDPERCFRKARKIAPNSSHVLTYLARFRGDAGDVEEALELYQEAIDLPSTRENFFAYISRAELCLKQYKAIAPDHCSKYLDQAKEDLEYILTKHESPWDYVQLADVYLQKAKTTKDSTRKREWLIKALHKCFKSENCQRGNEEHELYTVRGQCLCLLGRHERAVSSFERGIKCARKLGMSWSECWKLLAICQEQHRQGDEEASITTKMYPGIEGEGEGENLTLKSCDKSPCWPIQSQQH